MSELATTEDVPADLATMDPEDFRWPTEVERRLAPLTQLQRNFVLEYVISFNARHSVKQAGYKVANDNSAGVIGYRLIRHPVIGPLIADMARVSADEMGITRSYILARLRELADRSIDDSNPAEYSPQSAARALELLAKMRGDMIERKEVSVKTVEIKINDVSMDDLR